MGKLFYEKENERVYIAIEFEEILYEKISKYQNIKIAESKDFGRILILDGVIQTTTKDEYVYHEMITHVPLSAHPSPKNILIIGGGDGGVIKEALKHETVEKIDLVEIDEEVIKVSKEYLPEISYGLNNEKVNIFVEDGFYFLKNKKCEYDVIIVDSADPVGPAEKLFKEEFYISIYEALRDDGLFVCQSEAPLFSGNLLKEVYGYIRKLFPIAKVYTAQIPTYSIGLFSFTLGSKKYDPLEIKNLPKGELKYYNDDIHKACFALPNFIKTIIAAN